MTSYKPTPLDDLHDKFKLENNSVTMGSTPRAYKALCGKTIGTPIMMLDFRSGAGQYHVEETNTGYVIASYRTIGAHAARVHIDTEAEYEGYDVDLRFITVHRVQ